MANVFEYQSLPHEDSIRVLILAPGKRNEPLSGVLKVIHLSNRRQTLRSAQGSHKRRKTSSETEVIRWVSEIPYEAISYVWGTDKKDHIIILNGRTHQITANLSDALHQCRLPDQSRVLWADSICINQDKTEEKNHQVYLMGRIYASSQRTLICLGTDPDNRDYARDAYAVISDVSQMIQEAFQRPGSSREFDSFPWPHLDDPLVKDSRWQSVDILLRNPWFSRGWVVQEAALGREACILWAGCKIALLDMLRTELWYFRRRYFLLAAFDQPPRELRIGVLLMRKLFHERKAEAKLFFRTEGTFEISGILNTLNHASALVLGDPRDRIYAFMALPFVRNQMSAMHPNYEQPHLELYQDFAIRYLEETSDLNLLCFVTQWEANGVSLDGDLESSWVPRWDRRAWYMTAAGNASDKTNFGRTHTESSDYMILHGGNDTPPSLQVQAVIFGSIKLVPMHFRPSTTIEELATAWSLFTKRATCASRQDEPSLNFDSLTFLMALTRGYMVEATDEDAEVSLKSYSSFLQKNDQSSGSSVSPEASRSLQSCHRTLMNLAGHSCYFRLERGYCGLGPLAIQQEDICAFVFGVRMPLILRKVPDKKAAQYKVISPAFVVSKVLGKQGLPPGLNQWHGWQNWDELCEIEEWTNWGLKEETIILK